MNAIDLNEQYRLLSLWRLSQTGHWELVGVERSVNAKYCCRYDPEGSLYAFLSAYCPANIYQGSYAVLVRHDAQSRRR